MFNRKFTFKEVIGKHVFDFACRELKLVVVIADRSRPDPEAESKRQYLERWGWKFIVIPKSRIKNARKTVLEEIRAEVLQLMARTHVKVEKKPTRTHDEMIADMVRQRRSKWMRSQKIKRRCPAVIQPYREDGSELNSVKSSTGGSGSPPADPPQDQKL